MPHNRRNPYEETCDALERFHRLSEQESFIRRWLKGEDTVSELCRVFGVSRKTGHKRINRYWSGAGRVSETAAGSP